MAAIFRALQIGRMRKPPLIAVTKELDSGGGSVVMASHNGLYLRPEEVYVGAELTNGQVIGVVGAKIGPNLSEIGSPRFLLYKGIPRTKGRVTEIMAWNMYDKPDIVTRDTVLMKIVPFAPQRRQMKKGLIPIKAPLTGTFYRAPRPNEPPYVDTDGMSKVEENDVVCIIEAMKVMNEIPSGVAGTVAEIVAENGHLVQQDETIMYILPDAPPTGE